MLKKSNTPRAGSRNPGSFRLFKVLEVFSPDAAAGDKGPKGILAEYVDEKGAGNKVFLEATAKFVALKNASPNFMAKSENDKMHQRFYQALMRPTSNAEHAFRKGVDVISAKIFDGNGTVAVPGHGDVQKAALGAGFNIFARGPQSKPDPFDSNITLSTPADEWFQGYGRIIHDQSSPDKVSWLEVISPKGSPKDLNAFLTELENTAKATRGPTMYVRILDENGDNDLKTSVWPGKDLAEVEQDIADIRGLNLPLDRIVYWEFHPRVYLREDFFQAADAGRASKLDRLLRDIEYTYGVDMKEHPIEVDAVTYNNRKVGGNSDMAPIAVSVSVYANDKKGGELTRRSMRGLVVTGPEFIPNRYVLMTPEQQQRAALAADQARDVDHGPEQNQAPAEAAPNASSMSFDDDDVNFGATPAP